MRKYTSFRVVGLPRSRLRHVVVAVLLADAEQRRRVDVAGVDGDAGDDDARYIGEGQRDGTVDGGERRVTEAENDRVGTLDGDALRNVVHARREQQVAPARSWWLMTFTESDGLAMKKSVIGIERPGVMPASQVTPRLSVVAAGTRTVYAPCRR